MNIWQRVITTTLIFAISTATTYGQNDTCQEEAECYPSAYEESSRTTHWSVYIPVAAIVGAAILFGLADAKQKKHASSSQDALGSIANSKRVSHSSSSFSSSSSSSSSSSVSSSSSSSYSNYNSYKYQNNIPARTITGCHSH